MLSPKYLAGQKGHFHFCGPYLAHPSAQGKKNFSKKMKDWRWTKTAAKLEVMPNHNLEILILQNLNLLSSPKISGCCPFFGNPLFQEILLEAAK